ncbi:hypothetical protein V8F06_006238 [Rhypophila decipiens]
MISLEFELTSTWKVQGSISPQVKSLSDGDEYFPPHTNFLAISKISTVSTARTERSFCAVCTNSLPDQQDNSARALHKMGIACAVTCPSEPKPEAYTHPITKPILHNATQSPLARLPDKVLLNIMKHADNVSLLCLKRTCHTILRQSGCFAQRRIFSVCGIAGSTCTIPGFTLLGVAWRKCQRRQRRAYEVSSRGICTAACVGAQILRLGRRNCKTSDFGARDARGNIRLECSLLISAGIVLNIAEYVSDEKATSQPVATRQSPGTSSSIF